MFWKCLGAFRNIWELLGAFGSFWVRLAVFGSLCFGSVWERLAPSGGRFRSVWERLGASESVLEVSGSVWKCLGVFVNVWERL